MYCRYWDRDDALWVPRLVGRRTMKQRGVQSLQRALLEAEMEMTAVPLPAESSLALSSSLSWFRHVAISLCCETD